MGTGGARVTTTMNALCPHGFEISAKQCLVLAKERVQRCKLQYAGGYQWHSPELPSERLGRYRIETRPSDENFTGCVCGARWAPWVDDASPRRCPFWREKTPARVLGSPVRTTRLLLVRDG